MKPIFVDRSRIPQQIWNHPNILELEAEVLAQCADPEARKRICVHEAAHETYLHKLGVTTTRSGPFVYYDAESEEYHFAMASVCNTNQPVVTIEDMAKALSVGSVAARLMVPSAVSEEIERAQHAGPGSDFQRFAEFCKSITDHQFTDDQIRRVFDWAKGLVQTELQSPELQAEIWRVADDFGKEVFGEGILPGHVAAGTHEGVASAEEK